MATARCLSVLMTMLTIVQLMLAGVTQRAQAAAMSCPKGCFCSSQTKIVHCAKMGLVSIPDTVSPDAHEVNLNGNPFVNPVLQRTNFTSMRSLAKLSMSECGIEWIQMDAFRDLTRLTWLDLSGNRIREIQDSTFRGLNLQQLFLNGNRHVRLGADSFAGLSVFGVYLQDASLAHLTPEVFFPLNGSLKMLWLDGNALERLSSGFQPVFSQLRHLRLGTNPLHCGCDMSWLKEFYDARRDVFSDATPPSCSLPLRLRGRLFSEMAAIEMRCQAPVFSNIDTHFDRRHGRLRCSATGDPTPTLYWVRPSGDVRRYAPPANADAKFNEAILITDSIHHLAPASAPSSAAGSPVSPSSSSAAVAAAAAAASSGMYICIAANDVGNVTLTVNVTWPQALDGSSSSSSSSPSSSNVFQQPHTLPTSDDSNSDADTESDVNDVVDNGDEIDLSGSDLLQGPFIPSRHRPTSSHGAGSASSPSPHHQHHHHRGAATSHKPQSRTGDANGGENSENEAAASWEDEGAVSPSGGHGERRFTVLHLVCAVVGTHVLTLAICLLILVVYERRQRARRRNQRYMWATPEKATAPGKGTKVTGVRSTASPSTAPYLGPVDVIKQSSSYLTYADYTR